MQLNSSDVRPVGAAERKTKRQSKIGPDLSVSREEQTE